MGLVEVSADYGGRKLTLQTGRMGKQADGSVLVTYGETMVLVTVVSAREMRPGADFFPLTVDFQEKYYAAGRMPGGFFKREAKPSDKATLSARMTDRPLRPLFPDKYMYDTNVVATVLSVDADNEYDFIAQIGASAALHISDIPWNGPIAACRVGMLDGEFVLNIPPEKQAESSMELLVSGVRDGVVMVEGKAEEVSEAKLLEAIFFAHEQMKPIMDLQDELREKTGNKAKREFTPPEIDEALKKDLWAFLPGPVGDALAIRDKLDRYAALDKVKKEAKEKFGIAEPKTEAEVLRNKNLSTYFGDFKHEFARTQTLKNKKRIDGRGYADIRNIDCEVGFLPRVHGSSLFTRGETQVMATITLGTADDEQKIDGISGVYQKPFMLHYNFPPYSVGEARPLRPPGRREIGHGFLAERALSFATPSKEEFPYTIRVVCEVLESNGSSSMASVCSGTLAMMDAGVPIKTPVAGVAMGLMIEGDDVAILSDILGDEDHLGDMDFKVCGTKDGVTAFQMDLKIGGISREIMENALSQARDGRLHILSEMQKAMEQPREELSAYAPRIHTIKIKPEKVREVIGPGGKVIRGIIEQTGVKIDIEDDGSVHVASTDQESATKAIGIIEGICEEPEPGKIYEGKVTRIVDFGAFVEIIPGTEGLCHISELDHSRVNRVEDVVKEGEVIKVKCLEVDNRGKIRLSRRALLDGGPGEDGGRSESRDRGRDREARDGGGREGGRDRGSRGGDREDRDSRGRGGRGGDRGRGRGRGDGERSSRSRRDHRDHDDDGHEDNIGNRAMHDEDEDDGQLAFLAPDRDEDRGGRGGRDSRDSRDRGSRDRDSRESRGGYGRGRDRDRDSGRSRGGERGSRDRGREAQGRDRDRTRSRGGGRSDDRFSRDGGRMRSNERYGRGSGERSGSRSGGGGRSRRSRYD